MSNDDLLSDEKESTTSGGGLPAVRNGTTTADKEFPNLSGLSDASPSVLLPSEILLSIMAKIRMTIVYVGWFYSSLFFLLVVMSIVLLGPGIVWFTDQSSSILINFARIAISLVALAAGVGCIAIACMHTKLKTSLVEAELMIDVLRDQAFLQIQNMHYNLEELTQKLAFPVEKSSPSPLDYIEVAKKIGPLIALFTSKERSLVTLGVEGLKFYQSLKKILNR